MCEKWEFGRRNIGCYVGESDGVRDFDVFWGVFCHGFVGMLRKFSILIACFDCVFRVGQRCSSESTLVNVLIGRIVRP